MTKKSKKLTKEEEDLFVNQAANLFLALLELKTIPNTKYKKSLIEAELKTRKH